MISNAYADKILNAIVGKEDSISRPQYVYLGLCKNEPNASSGVVTGEPTAASYERKKVGGSSNSEQFGTASGGKISNSGEIQMKVARTSWGEGDDKMMWWFLSDSGVKGSAAIIWGELYDIEGNHGVDIGMNTVPTFYENQLRASIDVELT